MSLHAHLSPEAQARLQSQKRNSILASIAIALLTVTLVVLILLRMLIPALKSEPRVFFSPSVEHKEDPPIDPPRMATRITPKPSAPTANRSRTIISNSRSDLALPVVEVDVPEATEGVGSGNDFGDGWDRGIEDPGAPPWRHIPDILRKRCSAEDRLERLLANGGNEQCEKAVVSTLDWLKQTQAPDGGWCGQRRVAMTGFALLVFLGHCETPLSENYGDTVSKAIVFLVDIAAKQSGKLSDNVNDKHWPYEHAIATYALAEAYTFCKEINANFPGLHETVRDAGQWIIDNQTERGSWDYHYAESPAAGGRPSGGDNSIGCWHLQALKACHHTGIEYRDLTRCVRRGLDYIKECQGSDGAIGYTGPGSPNKVSSLAGAGALVFQMWGKSSSSVPRKACRYVAKEWKFQWASPDCDLYALYYNAQAMLNYGGKSWSRFNQMMLPELLKHQSQDGSFQDVGGAADNEINAVAPQFKGAGELSTHYRTCLAALTLEVYYRFLPGTAQQ